MKYKCLNCNYIYDEEKEALSFSSLGTEWICPECGAPKLDFELIEEEIPEAEGVKSILGEEIENEEIEDEEIEDEEEFEEENY
jgi:rubredoxin